MDDSMPTRVTLADADVGRFVKTEALRTTMWVLNTEESEPRNCDSDTAKTWKRDAAVMVRLCRQVWDVQRVAVGPEPPNWLLGEKETTEPPCAELPRTVTDTAPVVGPLLWTVALTDGAANVTASVRVLS